MSKKNDNMYTFSDFAKKYAGPINEYLYSYYLQKELNASNSDIKLAYSLLKEYCTRDGKRIRPLLLLLSYLGYGGQESTIQNIIPVAASLECMHAFLLIQDDIIDGAELRRGKAAFHKVCDSYYKRDQNLFIGSWVALVLADVLMGNALEMITSIQGACLTEFLREFAVIYERTALGQMLDIIWTNPVKLQDEIPQTIAAMKTAHYTVSGPLRLGYILTGVSNTDELEKLSNIGYEIGFAFQMRDDLIGVFGDEKDSGKSSSSDIEEAKYTVLVQKTIELLQPSQSKQFIDLFHSNNKSATTIQRIKEFIQQSGAIEVVQQIIAEHVQNAMKIIPQLHCNQMMKSCMSDFIESLFS